MFRGLSTICKKLWPIARQKSGQVICPLMKKECVETECTMWIDGQCAIVALAQLPRSAQSPPRMVAMNPTEILRRCAAMLGRASIISLRRREIDDFLASLRIVLNATQRRTLFRAWREARRLAREKHISDPRGCQTPQDNRGSAWSDDEDAELKRAFAAGLSIERIAANHGRSEGAIRSRLKKHGLLSDDDELQP